jgi:hypothetical protein
MFGQLPAVKNAFQSVISHGYLGVACLNAGIFSSSSNQLIFENLDFLLEHFPKHFYFIRKFSKSTG